jgi:class 3 adenylate cyclase
VPVAALPTGTLTFCFTDIEGSTQLWEQYPQAMPAALARHDAILRAATKRIVGSFSRWSAMASMQSLPAQETR